MLVKSARTVSREFYLEKRVYIGITHIVSWDCCKTYFAVQESCLHADYH